MIIINNYKFVATPKDKYTSYIIYPILICLLLIFAPLNSAFCSSFVTIDTYDAKVKYTPEKQWYRASTPNLLGWNEKTLNEAQELSKSLGSSAVVIIENGVVVDAWGQVDAPINIKSIRKSIMSAIYGIYVGEGRVKLGLSLNQLKVDDIDGLTKTEKQALVSDLLRSRSGVYHPAAYETKRMINKRPQRGSHPPGSFFYYNNWDFNALLTIFERQTKTTFTKAFTQKLAAPLLMQDFRSSDIHYRVEPSKSKHPAYIMKLSALDLARFGLLYLRLGVWNNKQIVPSQWVKQSTTAYSYTNKKKTKGYGFLWFIYPDYYYAAGTGGQRLIVYPDKNILIVHLVKKTKFRKVSGKNFRLLAEKILSAKK